MKEILTTTLKSVFNELKGPKSKTILITGVITYGFATPHWWWWRLCGRGRLCWNCRPSLTLWSSLWPWSWSCWTFWWLWLFWNSFLLFQLFENRWFFRFPTWYIRFVWRIIWNLEGNAYYLIILLNFKQKLIRVIIFSQWVKKNIH